MINLKADLNSDKKDANEMRMEGRGKDIITELTFILDKLYSLHKDTKFLLLTALRAFQKLHDKKSFDDFFKELNAYDRS